jgi:hypothetical protein
MSSDTEYLTYDEARTRKVAAEAAIAELELAKVRNELALVGDVVKAWDDVLSAMKAKLLALPTKMGPILAAETDAAVIQKKLEEQIRDCLDELSNYDPLSDPAGTNIVIDQPEGGDDSSEATAKTKRKSVGRPKKAAKFTE